MIHVLKAPHSPRGAFFFFSRDNLKCKMPLEAAQKGAGGEFVIEVVIQVSVGHLNLLERVSVASRGGR
jgi:hypothetical protein